MARSGLRSLNDQLDSMVARTSTSRDRYVDFLRAFSIGVVILWHWVFSVVHWSGGELVMPNPLDVVPLGWLVTWLLQVMPIFFVVGGFANLAGWESTRREGKGDLAFLRRRLARLLVPAALFALAWVIFDVIAQLLVTDYPGVLSYGIVVFMPLWFLAAYVWVVLLVPLTARLHRAWRELPLVGLGAVILLTDLGRFQFGIEVLRWTNSALVWVFVHQLGYFYRDGTLVDAPPRTRASIALGGLTALIVITGLDVYPRSFVAMPGEAVSHMWPTTAGIAALAVFQTAVLTMLRPAVAPWLERRRVWKAVISVNAVIMTLFLWHMTAFVAALATYEAVGGKLLSDPTLSWWLQRPLFLILPALFLIPLTAIFARSEVRPRA